MSTVEDIGKIIATISPDKYLDGDVKKIKATLKDQGFDAAIKEAKGKSSETHKLTYDSPSETLEPIYFWTVDKMNEVFKGDVQKYVDNFVSSPGSGHFAEFFGYMGKASKYQEESMKILGMVNNVIKAMINLVYDLKNFEVRLQQYQDANSKDSKIAEAGLLGLKQLWMDNVDIKRGRGSINAMSYELEFATLRDAFMVARSPEDVDKMDLNDRVKRVLKPRLLEFYEWRKSSEAELKKRYELEKTYLKSEVNALKLYTRWAKPYLKASAQLEPKEVGRKPEVVSAFNTIVLELVLLGKKPVDVEGLIKERKIGAHFKKINFKRKYYSCVVVDIYFRGIPQKIDQRGGYTFGGRTELVFKGYALNDDELKLLDKKFDESDFSDALKLVEGLTEESLKQIQEDLKKYIEGKGVEEKEKKEEGEKETNVFFALLGIGKKKKEEKKEEISEKIEGDNKYEEELRKHAEEAAKETCLNLFQIYKKAHGMPAP